MSHLNKFALFGMLLLSSILLANGIYSNQIFALDEENGNPPDQNGNLNEAEINADIELENKCKKDTECENENEINNQLSITTITQAQEEQETPTCEIYFTSILSEDQINSFIIAFGDATEEGPFTFIEAIFKFIDEFDACPNSETLDGDIAQAVFVFDSLNENPVSETQYEQLIRVFKTQDLM